MVFMNTGASSPLIAKKLADNYEKYKYQFRNTINSATMAKALCEDEIGFFIKMGYKKFAILAEDAAWNRGLVDYLKKSIPQLGGTVTIAINYDTATVDFSPIFSQIASSGAEFAVPLFAHTDTIALYKQWYEMKAPFRMGGFSNPGMHADYWKKTGGACISEVNIAWGPVVRANITPKSIPWFDNYMKKFGYSPHGVATTNYDGIYILADAIQRAKSIETAALINALGQTDYVGVCGRYVFDKKTHDAIYGDVNYVPFLITQWQEGGKFVVLWPEKLANGKFQNPPWLK
jgi:branched-chain amino acid transport system substrate-binding protein